MPHRVPILRPWLNPSHATAGETISDFAIYGSRIPLIDTPDAYDDLLSDAASQRTRTNTEETQP